MLIRTEHRWSRIGGYGNPLSLAAARPDLPKPTLQDPETLAARKAWEEEQQMRLDMIHLYWSGQDIERINAIELGARKAIDRARKAIASGKAKRVMPRHASGCGCCGCRSYHPVPRVRTTGDIEL